MVKSERLDAAFGALADPTRRSMVDRLARRGECTVGELAAPFAMSLPAVSKHVSVLERAGLVERRRVGRTQRCRLVVERLDDAVGWLEDRRNVWSMRLDRLAAVVEEDA
ncbi:MAG: metalloregulator ArsR/SmtB family transcription factor [Acidimicrobiia bacterium]